jgi:Presenilin
LLRVQVVGVLSLFYWPSPILLKQGYLVVTGVVVAYVFTWIPEWTTWTLLITMALYDLAAVLLPGGPLKVRRLSAIRLSAPRGLWDGRCAAWRRQPFVLRASADRLRWLQVLVELAQERDEDIPALVYEARPTVSQRAEPHRHTGTHRLISRRGLALRASVQKGGVGCWCSSTLKLRISDLQWPCGLRPRGGRGRAGAGGCTRSDWQPRSRARMGCTTPRTPEPRARGILNLSRASGQRERCVRRALRVRHR